LSRVVLPPATTDAERYAACPPGRDELLSDPDEDPLGWEAEGWE
jgi:hypothetical protein